jgi:hypothetical protein
VAPAGVTVVRISAPPSRVFTRAENRTLAKRRQAAASSERPVQRAACRRGGACRPPPRGYPARLEGTEMVTAERGGYPAETGARSPSTSTEDPDDETSVEVGSRHSRTGRRRHPGRRAASENPWPPGPRSGPDRAHRTRVAARAPCTPPASPPLRRSVALRQRTTGSQRPPGPGTGPVSPSGPHRRPSPARRQLRARATCEGRPRHQHHQQRRRHRRIASGRRRGGPPPIPPPGEPRSSKSRRPLHRRRPA